LARPFNALGFEGEEGWRVAARIKVVLLSEAGTGRSQTRCCRAFEPAKSLHGTEKAAGARDEKAAAVNETKSETAEALPGTQEVRQMESLTLGPVALAPSLWLDPDVRWLTGVHEADGRAYLVRERYEELLWWLLMPSLLRLAAEPALNRPALAQMGNQVDEALQAVESAGYRIDRLVNPSLEKEAEAPVQPAPVVDENPTQYRRRKTDKKEPTA
jgi:hypothetical protein